MSEQERFHLVDMILQLTDEEAAEVVRRFEAMRKATVHERDHLPV